MGFLFFLIMVIVVPVVIYNMATAGGEEKKCGNSSEKESVFIKIAGPVDELETVNLKDINELNANCRNALHFVAGAQSHLLWGFASSIIRDRAKKAEVLIKRGINLNQKDDQGKTPLHWAVINDHFDVADVLKSHGADESLRDNSNNIAFDYKVSTGHRSLAGVQFKGKKPPTNISFFVLWENHSAVLSNYSIKDVRWSMAPITHNNVSCFRVEFALPSVFSASFIFEESDRGYFMFNNNYTGNLLILIDSLIELYTNCYFKCSWIDEVVKLRMILSSMQ